MEANLQDIVTAAVRLCRQHGSKVRVWASAPSADATQQSCSFCSALNQCCTVQSVLDVRFWMMHSPGTLPMLDWPSQMQAYTSAELVHLPQAGLVELAYTACLVDEQGSWHAPDASADDGATAALSIVNNGQRIPDEALSGMASQLAQELMSPQDPAAAATAALQASKSQTAVYTYAH